MWFLPLLVIGIAVVAAGSYRERTYALVRPPPAPPGPIAVLGEFVRVGAVPPPLVIMCAIAEAEAIGRNDLASDIIRTFVVPVVQQHELANARDASPVRGASMSQSTTSFAGTDEDLRTMLDAELDRFVELATRGPQVIDVSSIEEPAAAAPSLKALPSPIDGVDAIDWSRFCDRLERETPLYQSARHVGQYRQRKERLAELGIDPKRVLGSAPAQRAALDADLADAHEHARASGLADAHLNRLVALPGEQDPRVVSLSGVLGVIQAAGLEGAVGWLENPGDRKRYPHTTAAFVRCNGVF